MIHFKQTFIGLLPGLLPGLLLTAGLTVCAQNASAQQVVPPAPAPVEEVFGLTDVEQIVGYDGLDRWHRRYLKQQQNYIHFGEYVLDHSYRKVKSGRRQLVLGSVLLLVGGTAAGLGVAVMNQIDSEEAYDEENSAWSGFGDALLGMTMIFVGMHGIAAGAVFAIMGGYKMRRYGRWRDRLIHAAAGSRRSAGPLWEGVGLQVGSGRFFVGTGLRF